MRRVIGLVGAIVFAACIATPAYSARVAVTLNSGPDWEVFSWHPTTAHGPRVQHLGPAQRVCLNAFTPSWCPADAVLYGAPFFGAWQPDISMISGASWVWAPGITGASVPAELEKYYFAKIVFLPGRAHLTTASFSISADDYAELIVNGHRAGSVGSITDSSLSSQSQSQLTTFDIGRFVRPGLNLLVVVGQNGPASFSPYCSATCSYEQNPAGVIFGGAVSYELP